MDIPHLYKLAQAHITDHLCSAHPYQHGEKLVEYITEYNTKRVLEIGTGIGYTATLMTIASPTVRIDTLEKDPVHAKLARKFIKDNAKDKSYWDRVSIINDFAETVLPMMQNHYDFIFFDGYQIHYEFLPQYKRLLNRNGILFLANNHLKSKTSDHFFQELADPKTWKILEQFDDTTIAQRM
jgi:predicted O-methyltransferase YrrM